MRHRRREMLMGTNEVVGGGFLPLIITPHTLHPAHFSVHFPISFSPGSDALARFKIPHPSRASPSFEASQTNSTVTPYLNYLKEPCAGWALFRLGEGLYYS